MHLFTHNGFHAFLNLPFHVTRVMKSWNKIKPCFDKSVVCNKDKLWNYKTYCKVPQKKKEEGTTHDIAWKVNCNGQIFKRLQQNWPGFNFLHLKILDLKFCWLTIFLYIPRKLRQALSKFNTLYFQCKLFINLSMLINGAHHLLAFLGGS
jgi:hypothetical protein